MSKKVSEHDNKNIVITYSMIEQKVHGIKGPGKYLLQFLGFFPVIPLLLALFSCFIKRIEDTQYKMILFVFTTFYIIILAILIIQWLTNAFRVFIVDDQGQLYCLYISSFWYKLKNKMYLLNPLGNMHGRLMRLFFMLTNIKFVLDSATENVSYEELIQIGKLTKITNIENVQISRGMIRFDANVLKRDQVKNSRFRLLRLYEMDQAFIRFLKMGKEEAENVNYKELFKNDTEKQIAELYENKINRTRVQKVARFTLFFTSIMIWIASVTLSGDLSKLSKINSGDYEVVTANVKNNEYKTYQSKHSDDQFTTEGYGDLYKPLIIVYLSIEAVYIFIKITDYVFSNNEQNKKLV